MSDQLSLLEHAATRGASGMNAPQTSVDAAHSISDQVLREQQARVLEAVVARGSANAHEVQVWLRDRGRPCPERNAIGSRFGEMEDNGWIVRAGDRPGATGRMQHVFEPTEPGRERLARYLATEAAA